MFFKDNGGWNNIDNSFWKDPWNVKFAFEGLKFPTIKKNDNFSYYENSTYTFGNYEWLLWTLKEWQWYRFSNLWKWLIFDILKYRNKNNQIMYTIWYFNFKLWDYKYSQI
jgi:hypothetical protein